MFEHVPGRIVVPSVDDFDRIGVEVVELPLVRDWDGPGRLTGGAARGEVVDSRVGPRGRVVKGTNHFPQVAFTTIDRIVNPCNEPLEV